MIYTDSDANEDAYIHRFCYGQNAGIAITQGAILGSSPISATRCTDYRHI